MFEFFNKPEYGPDGERRRIFCYYDNEKTGKKDFWCKVHAEIKDESEIKMTGFSLRGKIISYTADHKSI